MGVPLSQSPVRAGVSALMKHVHRWQLSRRRHDSGRPNVKGRGASWLAAVFRSVSIGLHPAARGPAALRRFVNLDEPRLSGLIRAHLIRSES